MKQVFKRPKALVDVPFHFCPGCHHGTIHRLVAECIDRYRVREKTIGVASVGCSVFLYDYINADVVEAPHGRAAAVATGVKRARPDSFVFTYQGDGDLAAIGTAEIVHAANRQVPEQQLSDVPLGDDAHTTNSESSITKLSHSSSYDYFMLFKHRVPYVFIADPQWIFNSYYCVRSKRIIGQ